MNFGIAETLTLSLLFREPSVSEEFLCYINWLYIFYCVNPILDPHCGRTQDPLKVSNQ